MKPRALIVEDNRAWQQILNELLTDAGLDVDVADGFDGAVVQLREQAHRLAIVDLSLGDGDYDNQDGLKVLDAIQQQDPGCVAIMLTGFATVELAVNVLTQHGAFHCLRKEAFKRSEFRALIQRALVSMPPEAVTCEFPATNEAVEASAATQGTILVIEDDAGWRSILAELLQDAGYTVRLCSSFGEALGCLRREQYLAAVVDLSLDGKNDSFEDSGSALEGYELLNTICSQGIPTLVVSGIANPEEIQRVYEKYEIFAFLEKQTFNRRFFLETLEEAYQSHAKESRLDALTRREQEVLQQLTLGLTNKEIAEKLFITPNTVKRHLKSIFGKLDVHTRAAAAVVGQSLSN